jgi:hypothetical protein
MKPGNENIADILKNCPIRLLTFEGKYWRQFK